jgi:twitching motility protein PilT
MGESYTAPQATTPAEMTQTAPVTADVPEPRVLDAGPSAAPPVGAPSVEAPQEQAGRRVDHIDTLLNELVERKGSDLHLKVGQPPVYRIHGTLVRSGYAVLTHDDVTRIVLEILSEERRQHLYDQRELDLAYSVPGLARFRVNCFFQSECIGAVLRVIPIEIRSCEQLGLPGVVKEMASLNRGLVLVTGPTGSGKSTTLAAMIDHINTSVHKHVVTVEDPIEFLHRDKLSTINQRELGVDTRSFAEALRHVLRQTPDVILVGELRDLETISLAITAAETGHLVLATLHTADAAQTVDRVIDVFPPEQQEQVRLQLSTSLQGVVSQTLLPRKDGRGRVAAFEILAVHSGVRNIIREGKTHQMYSLIQGGSKFGMQLLDANLLDLLRSGVVTYEEAIAKTSNPTEFDQSCLKLGLRKRS